MQFNQNNYELRGRCVRAMAHPSYFFFSKRATFDFDEILLWHSINIAYLWVEQNIKCRSIKLILIIHYITSSRLSSSSIQLEMYTIYVYIKLMGPGCIDIFY